MPQKQKRFDLEQITTAMEDQSGFCTACGAERSGCEPDARKYECEDCGEKKVYGAEELLVMGLVD